MRLDKFLQISRLVKRRTLANRLCGAGRVTVNGRRADPADAVRAGDVIEVETGDRRLRARVREVPAGSGPAARAKDAPNAEYCEILDGESPD